MTTTPTITVRILRTIRGYTYQVGQVADVPAVMAHRLLRSGQAERVRDRPDAQALGVEQATLPTPRRRGRTASAE